MRRGEAARIVPQTGTYRVCALALPGVNATPTMQDTQASVTSPHGEVVLIIDDELQIRRAIVNALRPLTSRVLEATAGQAGIDLAASARPDLIILDLGLPDMQGVDVCRELRRWTSVPIIVLSARHADNEKVALLTAGADDYVTKPFSMTELVARVQAHLRRFTSATRPSQAPIECDGLTIDMTWREVRRDGRVIRLTRTEWRLLHALASFPGKTLTHQQIFDAVWAKAFGTPQHYLRVHITNLRRKIERDPGAPRVIVTDPGVGYRFQTEDE